MRKIEAAKAWGTFYGDGSLAHWAEPNAQGATQRAKTNTLATLYRVRIIREADYHYLLALARQAEKVLASAKALAAELPRKKGRK